MQPVVYIGDSKVAVEDLLHYTICGTDLHILQGHVLTCTPGRVLGHEGGGVVDSLGAAVTNFTARQTVLISCITSCRTCHFCRKKMQSQCTSGGWTLGNTIDGTQSESINPRVAVTLSDTIPTAYELDSAKSMEGNHTLSVLQGEESVISSALGLTKDREFDVVIEAVGTKEPIRIAQSLVGAGGTIASLCVFGELCEPHLEKLWNRNICIAGGIEPDILVSHRESYIENEHRARNRHLSRLPYDQIHKVYNVFELASKHGALKVVVTMPKPYSNEP
ncbi:chaperonin 10-like protein [Aspergillus similis]